MKSDFFAVAIAPIALLVIVVIALLSLPEAQPRVSDASRTPSVQEDLEEPMKEESGPIEVAIDFEHEMDSRGRLRIVGETNLPTGTRLMFSLQAKTGGNPRQDKGQVMNGRFESAWFGSKAGPLPAGVYEAGVTVPVYNAHPDSVKRRLGPGLEAMTGPLTRLVNADFEILGKVASIDREVEVRGGEAEKEMSNEMDVRDRIAAHAYWSEPGHHFAWSNLEYALTSVQGVLRLTGRIKNIGPRDARQVHVKISMRNAQGQEVGRGNVNKNDGLKSGASWWFDGLMTVRKPGGVELYLGPESIVAFGYEY